MLSAAFLPLAACVLVPALALQLPVGSSHPWEDKNQVIFGATVEDPTEWGLDNPPNPNDTDHLVFETVHSLLQHWPNTRIRNGHNIVPGVIPKGTLLYHGKNDNAELPSGPDWVATDPEHSHIFCVDRDDPHLQQTCWLLSLATTRSLKIIYFDGTSAANLPTGPVDTQQLIAWGKPSGVSPRDEMRLVKDLCEWGKNFGVDGFVRMEMDFEIVLCDLTSGLRVISSANLPSRGALGMRTPEFVTFEVIEAGSWHNDFPGETRIQLDLVGLVSFYDTQLVPSLVSVRAGQERWEHRVESTSTEDVSAVKSRLQAALARPPSLSSGIDWKTLVQVIVDRFAGRLELTRHLLHSSPTNPDDVLDLANKTQTQLRVMLAPYILASATPSDPSDTVDVDWARPIYKLCATIHTKSMQSELDVMTDSEKSLLRAVRGTSREICRVVTKMWAAGVYAGIDPLLNTRESPDIVEVTRVWDIWAEDLDRLMGWLDWHVWVKCDSGCGPEEMCYLPTWPISRPRPRGGRRSPLDRGRAPWEGWPDIELQIMVDRARADKERKGVKPEPDEWVRPQPKCVRRLAPHEY